MLGVQRAVCQTRQIVIEETFKLRERVLEVTVKEHAWWRFVVFVGLLLLAPSVLAQEAARGRVGSLVVASASDDSQGSIDQSVRFSVDEPLPTTFSERQTRSLWSAPVGLPSAEGRTRMELYRPSFPGTNTWLASTVSSQQPAFPGHSTGRTQGERRVWGAVVGGLVGFVAGGLVGAAIDRHCACDDPGLKGFIVGAPIGAAGGAVIGFILASR
jgi:hypothetical protein